MRGKAVFLILFFIFLLPAVSHSQILITTSLADTIPRWESTNVVGLDMNQIMFVNWNVGGNNSIAGIAKGQFTRKYTNGKSNWLNELIFKYGLNSQEGQELRKTDDEFRINSTYGYRSDTISDWYYSAKFNFQTQFANGYAYPNTDEEISGAFSPAYIFLGIGTEYIRKEYGLNVYLSPLTNKTTLVLNNRLANLGAFGVEAAVYDEEGNLIKSGKNSRTEVGILVTNQFKRQIFKNIMLDHRISFYSDYINNFGKIDVDWQLQLDLTVNEYVKANIGTHIIYDDDIKYREEIDGVVQTGGPRIQLKQLLGVGLSYTF